MEHCSMFLATNYDLKRKLWFETRQSINEKGTKKHPYQSNQINNQTKNGNSKNELVKHCMIRDEDKSSFQNNPEDWRNFIMLICEDKNILFQSVLVKSYNFWCALNKHVMWSLNLWRQAKTQPNQKESVLKNSIGMCMLFNHFIRFTGSVFTSWWLKTYRC